MSDHVVIKKVERETIVLEDTYAYIFTTNSLMILIVCGIIFFSIGWGFYALCVINAADNLTPYSTTNGIGIGLISGLLSLIMFEGFGMFHEPLPAYEVRILGDSEYISILKTTPETDQVSICRAAQELEVKARAISKKERELEQIALRCK
jgi:hypothetical protein